MRVIINAIDEGHSIEDIYEHLLAAAQREIGDLWHAGRINVAEEHAATEITRSVMAHAVQHYRQRSKSVRHDPGRRVVLASIEGNVHDLGLRAIGDLLELAGWSTIYLGTDVPTNDLAAAVHAYEANMVMLSAALPSHLPTLQRAVGQIRAVAAASGAESPESGTAGRLHIIVGGMAFDAAPDLWKRLGADGYARTATKAIALAESFIEDQAA